MPESMIKAYLTSDLSLFLQSREALSLLVFEDGMGNVFLLLVAETS